MHNNVNLQKSNTVDLSNQNDSVESGGSFDEVYQNAQQTTEEIRDIDKLTKALEQQEKEKSDKKKLDEQSEQKEQNVATQSTTTLAQQKHILLQQQKNHAMGLAGKPKELGLLAVGQKPGQKPGQHQQLGQKADGLIKSGKLENVANKLPGSPLNIKEKGKQELQFAKTAKETLKDPVDLKAKPVKEFVKPEAGKLFDSARNERILKSTPERGTEPPATFMDHAIDNGTGQVNVVEHTSGSFLNPQVLHGAHASLSMGYQDMYKNWANYYRVFLKKSNFFVVYDRGTVFLTEEKRK